MMRSRDKSACSLKYKASVRSFVKFSVTVVFVP